MSHVASHEPLKSFCEAAISLPEKSISPRRYGYVAGESYTLQHLFFPDGILDYVMRFRFGPAPNHRLIEAVKRHSNCDNSVASRGRAMGVC